MSRTAIFLSHAAIDSRLARLLAEELERFGWCVMALAKENLPPGGPWESAVKDLIGDCAAFCALITPAYAASPPCTTELTFAIQRRPQIPRYLICVNDTHLSVAHGDVAIQCTVGSMGLSKREGVRLASLIDAAFHDKVTGRRYTKSHREIEYHPRDLAVDLPQRGALIRRPRAEQSLLEAALAHTVLAIVGPPAIGKSGLLHASLRSLESNIADSDVRPSIVLWNSNEYGRQAALNEIAAIVFEVVGPPPAVASTEPWVALVELLEECETWLVLDQFEMSMSGTGRCKDAGLARFLAYADARLRRGRILLTSNVRHILVDDTPLSHFDVPAWSDEELRTLLSANAGLDGESALAPDEEQALIDWAAQNPYLLTLAYRHWRGSGQLPSQNSRTLPPLRKALYFIRHSSAPAQTVVSTLSLIPFSVSRDFLEDIHLEIDGPAGRRLDQALAALSASGLLDTHFFDGAKFLSVPALVSHAASALRVDAPRSARDLLLGVARKLLAEGTEKEGLPCEPLFRRALFDEGIWYSASTQVENVTRAVRAAEILLSRGLVPEAIALLTDKQTLKFLNRFAPTSFRRRFYARLSRAETLAAPDRAHALRGLALALTDGADFEGALRVLKRSQSLVRRAAHEELRYSLLARIEAIKAYCLRHMGQLDASNAAYQEGIGAARRAGDMDALCKLLRGQANSERVRGALDRAEELLEMASDATRTQDAQRRQFDLGRIDCDSALLAAQRGDWAAAEEACGRGRLAMAAHDDVWNERIAALNLIGIQLRRGQSSETSGDVLQAVLSDMVNLENVVGVRYAKRNSEILGTHDRAGWLFLEFT